METLNEMIDLYNTYQEQVNSLEESMANLKQQIMELMDKDGLTKTTTDNGVSASITLKTTFKYDEDAAIKYLKENGYSKYVVEKIDSKKLNTELKKPTQLSESLKQWYTTTQQRAFSVSNK